ncbi:MAG: hypothetical protein E6J33_03480 [Chloroflexi bacterium]|nr:MAG: hypothetical protein E6J33_03480 [Chloroflexota bacterium]
MAKTKVNEATGKLTESLRETNQAIVETAVEAQNRNLAFAQNTFENGVELLKSHADSTRNLISEQLEQPEKQTVDFQELANSAIAAQERNVRYVQSYVQNGTEVLKSHVNSARTLMQILAEQSQKQQETFQALARESWDTYVDFLFTPFSYYRQAVETAESIARQGVQTAENISRQGVQAAQRVARQGQNAAESATK